MLRTPHLVEWLSDNGSADIAKETRRIATALGLRLAFTPGRSPERNGLSEAFVKALKRGYARLTILSDAQTIMAPLPDWFEDDNTVHHTPDCSFSLPREFRSLGA